ncbi:MAG: hypothetical protein WCH04_04310 [Gammaproteobacteria bacterium]
MVRPLIYGIALTLGMALAQASLAELLDDSLSPQQLLNLNFDWKDPLYSGPANDSNFTAVVAYAYNVETRLNTAKYLGQRARIFLGLPINVRGLRNPDSLRMSWTTNGLFSDGSVRPGNRQLIYQGTITENVMRDNFNFTFDMDGRDLNQTLRLETVYEIEIDAP